MEIAPNILHIDVAKLISRMDSSRGPNIERWTQMAFLSALEF